MSKSSSRHKHPARHIAKHTQKQMPHSMQKMNKHFVLLIVIAILTAIPLSMGKYFEFNSPGAFDSSSYVYSAWRIFNGAEIGVEEKPCTRLGTLTLNILGVWLFGFSETGPKIIQTIFQAAALVFMFIAMRKMFGTLAAAVGVIVASVYLSAPLIAKFGNVKEQYMIAFMVIGISCLVMRQMGGRWWWAVLAGGFASWAPLFKETGTSAIGAMGLFVLLQPVLKHRTWKQTGIEILLLLTGAVAAIAPFYIWIIGWDVQMGLPYGFVWQALIPAKGGVDSLGGSYISRARQLRPFSQQWPVVFRFYSLLILPIAMALGSIATRLVKIVIGGLRGSKDYKKRTSYDRFVLLLAVWWILDMAFIWISPRSYEQYYLPLNASAAMLGGYIIAAYSDRLNEATSKTTWRIIGLLGFLLMVGMSWHIFFGIKTSPHSGQRYRSPDVQRGYAQKLAEVSHRRKGNWKGHWEVVGEHIRTHSEPTDKIYVWGWFPGIYVAAQRVAPTAWPFTSEMHTKTPQKFAEDIKGLLAEFGQERPKFIVDSRKNHFPFNRPPLELWPIMPKGFMGVKEAGPLPLDANIIAAYDKAWSKMLRERFDEDEALRYEAMKPFREFVMKNYKIVQSFGQHILFKLKDSTAK